MTFTVVCVKQTEEDGADFGAGDQSFGMTQAVGIADDVIKVIVFVQRWDVRIVEGVAVGIEDFRGEVAREVIADDDFDGTVEILIVVDAVSLIFIAGIFGFDFRDRVGVDPGFSEFDGIEDDVPVDVVGLRLQDLTFAVFQFKAEVVAFQVSSGQNFLCRDLRGGGGGFIAVDEGDQLGIDSSGERTVFRIFRDLHGRFPS